MKTKANATQSITITRVDNIEVENVLEEEGVESLDDFEDDDDFVAEDLDPEAAAQAQKAFVDQRLAAVKASLRTAEKKAIGTEEAERYEDDKLRAAELSRTLSPELYDTISHTTVNLSNELLHARFYFEGYADNGDEVVRLGRVTDNSKILQGSYKEVRTIAAVHQVEGNLKLWSWQMDPTSKKVGLVVRNYTGPNGKEISDIEIYDKVYERFSSNRIRESMSNPTQKVKEYIAAQGEKFEPINLNEKVYEFLHKNYGLEPHVSMGLITTGDGKVPGPDVPGDEDAFPFPGF